MREKVREGREADEVRLNIPSAAAEPLVLHSLAGSSGQQ